MRSRMPTGRSTIWRREPGRVRRSSTSPEAGAVLAQPCLAQGDDAPQIEAPPDSEDPRCHQAGVLGCPPALTNTMPGGSTQVVGNTQHLAMPRALLAGDVQLTHHYRRQECERRGADQLAAVVVRELNIPREQRTW